MCDQKVLIIDSDMEHCRAIKYALLEYGIGAYYALSVVDGIERLMSGSYELVILDISISERDGLQLLRFTRNMRDMPILVLSSQGGYESWERAYQMGADDFIAKPMELQECLLRAQSLLRRYNATLNPPPGLRRYTIVNHVHLRMEPLTRSVTHNGRELVLTKLEFDLLYLLATHAGQVLTHKQIRYHVWGDDFVGYGSNAIPSSMSRLRRKLGDDSIETVRGLGYRFKKACSDK